MSIVNIVGGAFLLAFGRKIFWFFIAAIGFFAGYELASRYLVNQSVWVTVAIGVGVGILGALLAIFFERLAIGAAGFLAGAYLASRLAPQLPASVNGWDWLVILAGGIIGLILMYIIFEWALIVLSSLAGAVLIVGGFKLVSMVALIVGIILFVVGVIFQAGLNRRSRSSRQRASSS